MRTLLAIGIVLVSNICYGYIYLGGTDSNLSGSASLLLNSGTTYYGMNIIIPTLGLNSDQKVFFGGGYGLAGSSTATQGARIRASRDYTLIAPPSGTFIYNGYFWGASGSGSTMLDSLNIGSGTHTGIVAVVGNVAGDVFLFRRGGGFPTVATKSGSISVNVGTLVMRDTATNIVSGSDPNSPFTIKQGASLIGGGEIQNIIKGGGSISPGNWLNGTNAYNMMTFTQPVDPSDGLNFNFKFSGTTPNSTYSYRIDGSTTINDTILLENNSYTTNSGSNYYTTGSTAFLSPLSSTNTIGIYFPSGLQPGQSYTGGFLSFKDSSSYPNFYNDIKDANYKYYTKDTSGTHSFYGNNYSVVSNTLTVSPTISTLPSAAVPFQGTINNPQITVFNILAPIVSWLLLTACSIGLSYWLINKNAPSYSVAKSNINYSRSRPHKISSPAPYRVVKYKPYSATKNNTTLDYQPEKLNLPTIKPLFITQNKTIDIKEV